MRGITNEEKEIHRHSRESVFPIRLHLFQWEKENHSAGSFLTAFKTKSPLDSEVSYKVVVARERGARENV